MSSELKGRNKVKKKRKSMKYFRAFYSYTSFTSRIFQNVEKMSS